MTRINSFRSFVSLHLNAMSVPTSSIVSKYELKI